MHLVQLLQLCKSTQRGMLNSRQYLIVFPSCYNSLLGTVKRRTSLLDSSALQSKMCNTQLRLPLAEEKMFLQDIVCRALEMLHPGDPSMFPSDRDNAHSAFLAPGTWNTSLEMLYCMIQTNKNNRPGIHFYRKKKCLSKHNLPQISRPENSRNIQKNTVRAESEPENTSRSFA